MSNILGSLQVELTANTAKFVGDLGKAAHAAQQSAQQISREFSSVQRVASQTFSAFGSFGPQISTVTFALSQMSRAASSAMKEFGSTKSAFGAIASISAGATAALASVGVGAITVAARSAEAAAKLYLLSQSTGVSTEALSGLGFAAKQAGVEQETLVKGLERMDKSAMAAAVAPAGAINAYTRLGVSVRDSGGQIRTTQAIFEDLAARFASMPDGIAKTALMIEIFGRGGAALAPLLNAGKQGIDAMIASAQRLGLVISDETAAAAHEFERTLGELGATIDGVKIHLMDDLLPSMQAAAKAMKDWLSDPKNLQTLKTIAEDAAWCAKALMQVANAAIFVGRVMSAMRPMVSSELIPGVTPPSPEATQKFISAVRDAYAQAKKFAVLPQPDFSLASGFGAGEAFAARTRGTGTNVDLGAKNKGLGAISEKDIVGEEIGKLQAKAAAELALAGAIDRSTAAMLFQKAAGEAEVKIAELRMGLLTREKSLEEELANAKKSGQGQEAAKIQARIAGVQKELAALGAAAPEFTKLYAEIAASKASAATSEELQKKSLDFGRQIDSLRELAAAYASGGAAIAGAEINKQLEAEKQKLEDLRAEYARLQDVQGIGIVSQAQGQGPSPALEQMGAAVDAAAAKFEELKKQAAEIEGLRIDAEIGKQIAAFREEAGAVADVTAAYFQSEAARRAAQVGEEVAKYRTANPAASDTQVGVFAALAKARSDQAFASSAAQVAAEYQIQGAYDRTREKLEAARAVLIANGESTLAIDDKIYNEEMSHREEISRLTFAAQNSEMIGMAKIYDLNRQQIEQWDQMAMKVGTFGEKMRAVLNQIALDSQNVGAKIAASIETAIGGVEDQLAKLIVTGKSNFKQVFESFAESAVKAQLQFAAGGIEKALGFKVPGLQGKRGDSAGNPLYVLDVSGSSGNGNLPLGPGFGSGAPWSMLANLGKPGSITTPPFFPPNLGSSSSISSSAIRYPREEGSGLAMRGDYFAGIMKPPPFTGDGDLPLGHGFGSGSESPNLMPLPAPDANSSPGGGSASIFGSITSSIGNVFTALGGKSKGDSSGAMSSAASALRSSASALSRAASALKSAASSLSRSSGSSGGGGWLTDLLSSFGGGGGGSSDLFAGGAADSTSGLGDAFSSSGDIAFAAGGGDVSAGHAYIVGEKRPELFVPKTAGTIIPSIGAAFRGFRASGGDVSSGHAYIVGEKRPELFVPKTAGTIIPSIGAAFGGFRARGGDVTPGHAYMVGENQPEVFSPRTTAISAGRSSAGSKEGNTINLGGFHVHGATDHDSFKRSQSQIYANLHAQMALAQQRG